MLHQHLYRTVSHPALWAAIISQSKASTLLSDETEGFALYFADDFFYAGTGFYGSARIKDITTPAFDYDSIPDGLRTTSTPIAYTGAPPSGADIVATTALQTEALSSMTECTVIATFLDGGTEFKGGVSVGSSGIITAWDGVSGASVPGGLSGACRLVYTIVLPRAVSEVELLAGTSP
jgi:hypothetical protein